MRLFDTKVFLSRRWYVTQLSLTIGTMLAYLMSAAMPNVHAAIIVLPTYLGATGFFAGLVLLDTFIPPWWHWWAGIGVNTQGEPLTSVGRIEGCMDDLQHQAKLSICQSHVLVRHM